MLVKYTTLPRQLLLYHPNQQTCIYASVVNGWIRMGMIGIQAPFGPAPTRDDEEAWMWLGRARFPDPGMAGTAFGTKRHFGAFVTGSLQIGSLRLYGVALPCWLTIVILLTPALFMTIRKLSTRGRPGTCTKCGYNLEG